MIKNGEKWYSSFLNEVEVKRDQAVITVLSGSSFGGHASMYVEYQPRREGFPKMLKCDLGTVDGSRDGRVWTNKIPVQYIENGEIMSTNLPKMTNNNTPVAGTSGLESAHHHSYVVDDTQTSRFLDAVDRFEQKAKGGRYLYSKPGGALGAIFSKPGRRALNCADFVIKVLNEAGIADIGYRLFDTPYRVAS